MPLIVETGTGASDSEAFCSVAFADTYLANRGNTAWALLVLADKEAAIRRAADYMQQAYRLQWAGFRVKDTQALDWPRYDVPRSDAVGYGGNLGGYGGFKSVYPFDAVPVEVQRANAEMALRAAAGELTEDIDAPVASESVGPISVTYFQGGTKTKAYPAVDRLLAPFLQGGNSLKLVRG